MRFPKQNKRERKETANARKRVDLSDCCIVERKKSKPKRERKCRIKNVLVSLKMIEVERKKEDKEINRNI